MTFSIHVAGWTLVHFVWQGALVGFVAAVALRLLRSASAQTRYALACAALAAMLAAPIVTARLLSVALIADAPGHLLPSVASPDTATSASMLVAAASQSRYAVSVYAARVGLDTVLPILVTGWFAGVAFLLLRLAGGWWRVRRLHLRALESAPSRWQAASDRIASRLAVNRRVQSTLHVSIHRRRSVGCDQSCFCLSPRSPISRRRRSKPFSRTSSPTSVVTDYLVNLLQTLAETLLFYHPAVWWVSSQIRVERENCCDDVAVNVCGDAIDYAAALTELETWRTERAILALAATDGSLLARVRRLLLGRVKEEGRSSAATAAVTLALVSVMLVVGWPRLSASQPTGERSALYRLPAVATTESFEVPSLGPVAVIRDPLDHLAVTPLQAIGRATLVPVALTQAAQDQSSVTSPGLVAFEVASVKPNASGPTSPMRGGVVPGERVTIVNEPLRTIIQMAYGVNLPQIIGAPSWIANEHFDITAKAETLSSANQLRAMLQTLLADRFKLRTHVEMRDTPVYALVIARSDGRLGPQLHPEAEDCEPLRVIARSDGSGDPCPSTPSGSGVGRLSARSRPIDLLATLLAVDVDRPVVNRTGLIGSYDWDLTATPRRFLERPFDHDQFPTVDPDGPTIFTAVQEQLGLKLEPSTGPETFLVIDHVERPTGD
jgi:uncharacterized protein (TIGR03435 family)